LPRKNTPANITGTILHDLATACVGYDTYFSASLEQSIAVIAQRLTLANAESEDRTRWPSLDPAGGESTTSHTLAIAAFVEHCTKRRKNVALMRLLSASRYVYRCSWASP